MSIWEAKHILQKVKNAVLNYTETEAKVREATNNDPWGASSTLMEDIANRTKRSTFYEVMNTIYKRLNERQWRNIYKALTLLEYCIKHGSEKVISYANEHLYDLKALKNFHHIDSKGKDQGINGNFLFNF